MMGSIGDMAYLASRSDVLIASQAIFHLSHLKFVGVPTCSCQGRSQATRSMRRMAASRAPTAAASCSLPSGPRGSRMARSSWAAMSSFIPRSRSWLPSVIGHLSLYVTALVVELLRCCSPLRGLACASVFALSASFSSALGPHVSMVAFSGPCQALCLWHPQLLERAPDRRDGTAP